ncbi:MAG TPA: hypothetical protein VM077_01325 [Candidatus Limnocylindrales bacterium]|nr:hypothetical protein [Candidatus Limnocylindrales bacterium]
MIKYKQFLTKTIEIIKAQWKLFGLVTLIVIFLIITFLLPIQRKKSPGYIPRPRSTNQSTNNDPNPSKKPANIFGFLFGVSKKDDTVPAKNIDNTVKPPPNIVNEITSKSTVVQLKPDGTKVIQTITGGSAIKTIQGTINPNTNVANDLTSNQQVDNIRVVFKNPDGSTITYIPPGTPPDDVRWARYTNNEGKYAINYPYNWQFVYSLNNGQEGVALYPPNVNFNDPNAPYIGFGLTDSFLLPAGGNAASALITPIIVDGVQGNLYTDGPLGTSYIASIMQYSGKSFGLGSNRSTATFAYVYYYMLNSLTFDLD